MSFIRSALIVLVVVTVALMGWMFSTFDADYELTRAQEQFLKGEYSASQRSVERLSDTLPIPKYELLQSYIARAKNDLEASDAHLSKALATLNPNQPTNTLLEIYLNQGLNAYIRQDYKSIANLVDKVAKSFPENRWMGLLEGLAAYHETREYETAAKRLLRARDAVPLNPWMNRAFGSRLTPVWFRLHIARCEIETGNYLKARQLLEGEEQAANEHDSSLFNLLLGLSYIKEAQNKPLAAATPYYKLAFSYIDRLPIQHPSYRQERQELIGYLSVAAHKLVEAQQYRDLDFYTDTMVRLGDKESADEVVNALVDSAGEQLHAHDPSHLKMLTDQLNNLVKDPVRRQSVSNQLEQVLLSRLKDGESRNLMRYWNLARQFNSNGGQLQEQLAELSGKQALRSILRDDESLSRSSGYLTLWDAVEQQPQARLQMARELLKLAAKVWQFDEQEIKAEKLLKIAASLPAVEDRGAFIQEIHQVITAQWNEVARGAEATKVESLRRAATEWNLRALSISDEEAARHLSNAERAIEESRFEDANKALNWLLALRPDDIQAKTLQARTAYLQGDYSRAHQLYQAFDSHSDDICAAVAKALTTYDTSEVEQMAQKNALDQDALVRMALGVAATTPGNAEQWIARLNPSLAEAELARTVIAAEQQRWAETLDLIDELPQALQQLPQVTAIRLQALIALEESAEAEVVMEQVLEMDTPSTSGLSLPLRQFIDGPLKAYDPHWIVAQYRRDIEGKDAEALEMMLKITHPSRRLFLERGEALAATGRHEEAIDDLAHAAKQGHHDPDFLTEVLPVLAQAHVDAGHPYEAAQIWEQLLKLSPDHQHAKARYADALNALHKHDKALQLLLEIRSTGPLSQEMHRPYLHALIFTDHTTEAVEQATIWLKQEQPLCYRLQLADELNNFVAIGAITEVIDEGWQTFEKDELTAEQASPLFSIFYNQAQYDTALELSEKFPGVVLQKHRIPLAQLLHRTGENDKAMEIVDQSKHPQLAPIRYAIHNEPTSLQKELEVLRTERKDNLHGVSATLSYAHKLAELTVLIQQHPKSEHSYLVDELMEAYYLLDQLALYHPDLPEAFLALGRIQQLQGEEKSAIKTFEQAVAIFPYYSPALRELALLNAAKGDNLKAIEQLKVATAYDPQDARAWQQLGELYVGELDPFEAKQAFANAVKIQPRNRTALVALGRVLLDLKNPEDAKAVLETAIMLKPDDLTALKLLLTCLHDQSLEDATERGRLLRKEKISLYQRIHEISPEEADAIFSEYERGDSTRAYQQQFLVQ